MEFFVKIIEEKDFIPLADRASVPMRKLAAYFSENKNRKLTKKLTVAITKESMELEDFLDDHGARKIKSGFTLEKQWHVSGISQVQPI